MTPSLEGWSTKAKEVPSPHEVRLSLLNTNPVFYCLGNACRNVSSIQPFSKMSQMVVSFLKNDSLFHNLQEYNQFHIDDNVSRTQWWSKVAYILLIFIWIYFVLPLWNFGNDFWKQIFALYYPCLEIQRSNIRKSYTKEKVRYSFPKNIKFHFCPSFRLVNMILPTL